MPCHFPLQANFHLRADGKKDVKFSNVLADMFEKGIPFLSSKDTMSIPCGRCMGCRLEKSRQAAVRCLHEASMYEKNSFITLTYDDEHLPKDGSLDKSDLQKFFKRLRREYHGFSSSLDSSGDEYFPIRYYACGEYGDQLSRPHYHSILFNFDFPDKVLWKYVKGIPYYISQALTKLWGLGHCCIGEVTFDSCAYVARYCTKKITGDRAKKHYGNRTPEFMVCSLKPGIGKSWLDRFGKTDVFPHDVVVSRGVKCKPPRYYDKILERVNPQRFEVVKELRKQRGESKAHDFTYARLRAKEACQNARIRQLVRSLESASV